MTEKATKKDYGRRTVRLERDVHKRAKKAAVDLEMDLQQFVTEAIELRLRTLATMRPHAVSAKGGKV